MMHDGLKTGVNYLLGRKAFPTTGDRLLELYNAVKDPGKMNKFKYHTKDTMILGDIWKLEDSMNYWNDYMSNRNIDWSDVKYPTMLSGFGVSSLTWTSDINALKNLYD